MELKEGKYLICMGQALPQAIVRKLLEHFDWDAERCWHSQSRWLNMLENRNEQLRRSLALCADLDADAAYKYCVDNNIRVSAETDEDFPDNFRHIVRPPCYFTYLGTLPDPKLLPIAVVGARRADDYGKQCTRRIVSELADVANAHIISGMAEGIDGLAHRCALDNGGFTTAVLGCGIDVLYPRAHKNLKEEIAEKGCIISELPLGASSLPSRFPERNRLISGLSRGILVIQGTRKSGSSITVSHGLEQGKDIFALPGPVNRELSALPHHLIKTGQAKLCACAMDIIEDYMDPALLETREAEAEGESLIDLGETREQRMVLSELELGRRSIEELETCGMDASELMAFLTELEIKGVIRDCGGNYFEII